MASDQESMDRLKELVRLALAEAGSGEPSPSDEVTVSTDKDSTTFVWGE